MSSSDNFDDAYDNEADSQPLEPPPGDFPGDSTYIAGPESEEGPIPVQRDDAPLDNYIDPRPANSKEVLGTLISILFLTLIFLMFHLVCR